MTLPTFDSLTFHFWPVIFQPCLLFWTDPRLFITDISLLTSWFFISKFWPVTPWPVAWWPLAPASLTDDVGHNDLWHQDLSPHRPSTLYTFHPTDLRPVTFDTTTFDTIIFDSNHLRLLNLSFLPSEFRTMFIIFDRSTPFHRGYFTFDSLAFDFQVLTCDPMTFCQITFGTSIFDRWCWTPWPMTPRSFTSPTFDSTDLSPYRPSTRDLWHYDLWHHNLWPEWPSTSQFFIFALWVSSHVDYFGPIHAFHRWYFTFDSLAFDFQGLTCDPMTFCLINFGTSIFDRWCWTPWPMTPTSFTSSTFDSTDLSPYRPSTRDLWHYDHNSNIIFDLNDLRLLNLSFFTCEFRAMFTILDQSTPLHHWYFTFGFLAFHFQVLTCDPMTFCLMTFGTSIFDRLCLTPRRMTPRSFTWPTFDSTDLSPYRPSTRGLWHYDHNSTIIFDLTDLRILNL